MSDLYTNLLKATSNIDDITTEKYATITKTYGNYCDAKEEETGLEHTNVPILNGAKLQVGDKAIIGFLNNSIYETVCYGVLDRTTDIDSSNIIEESALTNLELGAGANQHQINLKVNEKINQGGGSSVDIVTSWETTLSDTKVPSEKLTKNSLDAKVDSSSLATVATTGDYDDLTDKPTIPSDVSDLTDNSNTAFTPKSHTHGNITNDGKVGSNANYFVYTTTGGAVTSKQKIGNITTKGAIGSTSGLPIITTTSGALTTGSFGSTAGTFAEGNHTHSAYVNPTKVTSWSGTPSDDNVASEKLIKDSLDGKQASLVSGTNIKTINNESLLGSGNISISGGGGSGGSCVTDFYIDSNTDEWVIETTACSQGEVVTSWSSTLTDTKVPSEKLVKEYVDDLVGAAITYINGSGS